MSDTIPQTVDEITPTDVKRITGWIGRHALPSTLPDTMPEYRTALALGLSPNQGRSQSIRRTISL